MSEEILKALMQLFAIIAKQDGGVIENHEKYVLDFLSSQLNVDRVEEYITIYNGFLNEAKPESPATETTEVKRTSMKDSVRTLAICKKINKTLVQKQKFIVLVRLLEFFKNDVHRSVNRVQIVETASDVFKIEKQEFDAMRSLVFDPVSKDSREEILIGDEKMETSFPCKKFIPHHNLNGVCRFMYLKTINLVILKYEGNSEIFLNGIVIKPRSVYLFPQGSTLRLPKGSVYFANIISGFQEEADIDKFSFYAHIKKHQFPNGTMALHELKISESSGHLVGIMGASGSGKTTLLTILSGQERPYDGDVLINQNSIFKPNKELEGAIGFVPQDDLLIEDLTVYQNLYYNAKLCFDSLPEKELRIRVSRVLISLGLEEIKNITVGSPLNKKISGGQRKRLNIALELIREPAILFLDEPTSGLSSRDSENVMDLLKELTFRGKLVFVVIHQPSSDIFKMFDRMLILDTGGYAAYYGNPIEAVMYFKKTTKQINSEAGECYACGGVNPETIFNLIELKELDEYGNYTDKRKLVPKNYYDLFREHFLDKINPLAIGNNLKRTLNIPGLFKQIQLFFVRDLLSKISNRQYILLNLIEVPALALFLSLIIRFTDKSKNTDYTYFNNENIPAFFFMSLIAGLLVGLTVSAEEIYKDQKILKRERFLHLSRLSYLLSKVSLLFILSLVQTVLFTCVGFLVLGIHENFISFGLVLFSVFCSANLIGLVLSSTFNSPVTIYIIIPLIIIPQMVLGGAMFKFSKLNSFFGGGYEVPVISNFVPSRWAYEAIATDMYINNSYEKEKYETDKLESKINYKLVYLFPQIEDLFAQSDSGAIPLSDKKTAVVIQELNAQLTEAVKFGFKFSGKKVNKKNVLEITASLKNFYSEKFNELSDVKEKKRKNSVIKFGGEAGYEKNKLTSYNNNLEEVVTNSFEKSKILIDENKVTQIIDPVFQEPQGSHLLSLSAPFYIPVKYFMNKKISTYWFNFIMMWVFNMATFCILYFDLLKKTLGKLGMK